MNHEQVAARVESISMATGIIAGISALAATVAAPSGLTAFGVWLGLVDEPLIVTLAPVMGSIATATGTLSGATYFLAMRQRRRLKKRSMPSDSAQTD